MTAPTAVKASSLTCRPTFTSSAMCIPMEHSTSRPPPKKEKCKGPARKKGDRLPGMKQWADDPDRPWTKLKFNQFGLYATLEVKTIQALYYKAGKDRLLTIVLMATWKGNAPIRCSIVPSLIGRRGKSLGLRFAAGPLNAPLKIASSSWAWRTLPIVFPRPSCGHCAAGVVHLHSGSGLVSPDGSSIATLSLPALVHQEGRTIVCRHVDDPEAG